MIERLAEHAPAKVNLFLRVVGRRSDGYHQLDSVFVPISIADRVALEVRPASAPRVSIRCEVASLADPNTNLAARAADAFMREFDTSAEVVIELEKTIPMGAGLGGGSSDAGAVLRMMARMYSVDLDQRLEQIALSLGADVPFFLNPHPARVGGIGERITLIDGFPILHMVVAVPAVEVPTGPIFKALKPGHWSGIAPEGDIASIFSGRISPALTVNDLARVAVEQYPEIGRLRSIVERSGAIAAQMSGSGGSVFGVFNSPDDAARAAESIGSQAPEARVFAATSVA